MFIPPMLLETAKEPFDSEDHIFEPKIDGHRMIYSREEGKTRLYTRHENEVTAKYPELLPGFEDDDIVLDGEVAQADPETGEISFEALNDRFRLRNPEKIEAAANTSPVTFVAFDILRYQGKDLRQLPLNRRKEILAGVTFNNPCITIIPYVEHKGMELFHRIQERGMEGIVAKEKSSKYATGRRAGKWQKIINWTYVDVVITGYRRSQFGWQASIQEGDDLRPVGTIELGVNYSHKKAFYEICHTIESGSYREYVHLEPILRAKVKTRNFTRTGMLRDPIFVDFIA